MLEVKEFSVIARNKVFLLEDVSLRIMPGKVVGLTGQSGAGKTTLIKSILGLLNRECKITGGEILIDGVSLYSHTLRQQRDYCGIALGFIPQNPMTAFDSRIRIGKQLEEVLHMRRGLSGSDSKSLSIALLSDLGLSNPERVLDSYPVQLSGGMLQRVTMALLLALKPKYILADEPTSALDKENQALLLTQLKQQKNHSGILFISHDVNALNSLCDIVHVMEMGRLTESGTMKQLIDKPKQPWTQEFSFVARGRKQEAWTWTD